MNKQIKRGLIVGRFQPYHLGHHEAIKRILKEVDELVIIVGSSRQSHESDNPFTAGERIEMISAALKAEGLYNSCYIIPVPDMNENALWTAQIKSYAPRFEVVYSNNPLVRQLFRAEGFGVREMVSNLPEIESVRVRDAMFNGKNWKKMLPTVLVNYLEEKKAIERIKAIAEKEKKQ